MNSRIRMVLAALSLSLISSAGTSASGQGRQETAPSPPVLAATTVLKAEELTKEQFKALPDSAAIELRGQRTTAGAIRAYKQQREKRVVAELRARARQSSARIAAMRAQLLKKQKATLDAENAKARIEVARLSREANRPAVPPATLEAITKEARELHARFRTAPPAERLEIQQRARELQGQLLGR